MSIHTSERAASLSEFFSHDHRRCDALYAELEERAERGDPEGIASAWSRFDAALRSHLAMEEEVMFPAFEEHTGMRSAGPTFVMRSEHRQMRGVLDQMGAAFERNDVQQLLDQGDTLLMLIQQHNSKEENMLYPMAEQALAQQWPELQGRLAEYAGRG